MLFTSIIFISVFLPLVIIGYWLIPKKFKNLFIFISSLIFYIWGEQKFIFLLLGTILINYGCSILIEKGYKKLGLWTAIITSLGSLFYFKYANFAYTNIHELLVYFGIEDTFSSLPTIVLPLGISFFTFQVLSYTIDVYRGHVHASKSFLNFATYVTLFPHLIAGPIVRYAHIESQLLTKEISVSRFTEGLNRFIIGLAKKMIIANNCGIIADTAFNINAEYYSPEVAWLASLAYTLQIFFDFSAYSDMAIGIAKILGFDFHENFNYPYISKSIKEFWRRWHISLSSWFRDYLYIPLGGSRVSVKRTYLNLFIVFAATGIWHGASWNFIIWGFWHGLFIVAERMGIDKFLTKTNKGIQHIYTLLIVIIGWVIFRADNFSYAIDILKRMFYLNTNKTNIIYNLDYFITLKNCIVFILAIILCLPTYHWLSKKIHNKEVTKNKKILYRIIYQTAILSLLFISIILISQGTYNPFIYFRF